MAITEESLARQASLLRSRGYDGLTLGEAELRRQQGTLPRRSVVFTFDDGYTSTLAAEGVLRAERLRFQPIALRDSARRFDVSRFRERVRAVVEDAHEKGRVP